MYRLQLLLASGSSPAWITECDNYCDITKLRRFVSASTSSQQDVGTSCTLKQYSLAAESDEHVTATVHCQVSFTKLHTYSL